MNPAMRACLRARQAWERAGRPGAQAQLQMFPAERFRPPEAHKARLVDRPRKQRR